MINKKFMILTIFFVSLLAVSAVSAADNATEDIVGVENQDQNVIDNENKLESTETNEIDNSGDIDESVILTKESVLSQSSVTVSSYSDLINEIQDAKYTNYGAYTINLKKGTYVATQDMVWWGTDDDIGGTKTLIINGNGATLNGANKYGFILVCDGYTLKLNDIKLENYARPSNNGGAISNWGALIINNCEFRNNKAVYGGAIYNIAGLMIKNSVFDNNVASGDGGAIYTEGNRRVMIDGQSVSADIQTSTFNCNKAISGGAIFSTKDESIINNNIFTNNEAQEYGGAIYNGQIISTPYSTPIYDRWGNKIGGEYQFNGMDVDVTKNTFSYNKAVGGAAIYNKVPSISIDSNTFKSNQATSDASQVIVNNAESTIISNNNIEGTKYKSTILNSGKYSRITNNDFNEKFGTKITIMDNSPYAYNGNQYIVATLKDDAGNAINGAKVTIKLGTVTKTLTTDKNGQVSLTTNGLNPDTYTATATFAGDNTYSASSANSKITINEMNTVLTAKYDSSGKNIVATVKDANGKAVSGLKVGFAIGGVKYVTTDANGQAKYSTTGLADGTYKVTVQAYGNDLYKDSNKQTVSFTIGSKQQAKIYLRNALYFVLQTKMVTVTLWDANKNPIAGKTVHINLDEYGLKYSGVTDENGDANIRVGVGFGNHPATVSFEGDDQYFGDSKTGRVRVIKETPSLMLPGAYTKFKASDSTKTVNVYLKDRYNKPLLKDTKVFVTINGKQYVGSINSEGIATININLNSVGVYNVDLYYTGNTAYNAVRKTTKITIV